MKCPICQKPMRFEARDKVVVFGCTEDIRHCKGIIQSGFFPELVFDETKNCVRCEPEIHLDWWEYGLSPKEPGNARSDDLGAIQGKSQGESEKACPGSPKKLKARK